MDMTNSRKLMLGGANNTLKDGVIALPCIKSITSAVSNVAKNPPLESINFHSTLSDTSEFQTSLDTL